MADMISTIKSNVDIDIINYKVKTQLFDLITFTESKYKNEIEVIAANIVYGNKKFVLLAGPSSSGKTTSCRKLCQEIRRHGKNAIAISLDDFFMNRDTYPKNPDGSYDFETFDILDVKKFNECIDDLITKNETDLPEFDFYTGKRKEKYNHITVSSQDIIVIEGTHALNPNLLTITNVDKYFYKVYICTYTNFCKNGEIILPAKLFRMLRRMIRDVQSRGTSIEETLKMWNNVCIGEDLYIKPYKNQANYLLDTTHIYEPYLYHKYLENVLNKNKDDKYAKELLEKLSYFGYLTEEIVPSDSMIWEFLVKEKPTEDLLKF